MNAFQQMAFKTKAQNLSAKRKSLAASAGLFLGQYHFDLVRPGIAIYGGNPQPGHTNKMTQVLKIQGKSSKYVTLTPLRALAMVLRIGEGPTQIATVALGYADGYLRSFSNSGRAWIGGHEVQVAGRVSMDLTTLDVTGSPVSYFQAPWLILSALSSPINQMAEDAGTIDYEILTRLGSRFGRHYSRGPTKFLQRIGALTFAFLATVGGFQASPQPRSPMPSAPVLPADYWPANDRDWFFSLPVVGLTAVFAGMVLALQSFTGFSRFNAEGAVANVVVISITRELGPVLAGLMVSGRIGASMAAEIGTMRVTEQVDALTTLSTNPLKYLVAPRIIAGLAMLPLLVFIADIIGVLGGYLVSVFSLGFNAANYLQSTFDFMETLDVVSGLVKAAVFGMIIAIMGCYHGYHSQGGPRVLAKRPPTLLFPRPFLFYFSDFILTGIFFATDG